MERVNIEVKNPNGICKGVKEVVVNGTIVEGNEIPFEMMNNTNDVVVTMG